MPILNRCDETVGTYNTKTVKSVMIDESVL